MAIVFSEDFNDQTTFDAQFPGSGYTLNPGGCTNPGGMYSCWGGNITSAFTPTSTEMAWREQRAVFHQGANLNPGTGGLYVLTCLLSDGSSATFKASIDAETGSFLMVAPGSPAQTSAAGVMPTDGTFCGVQYRWVATPFRVIHLIVEVNNAVVWDVTYDWSSNWGGVGDVVDFHSFNLWGGEVFGPLFSRFALDNLEIDDSSNEVDWPACPDAPPIGQTPLVVPTISTVDYSVGGSGVVITGTNYTGDFIGDLSVTITTSNGPTTWTSDDGSLTIDSSSATELDCTLVGGTILSQGSYCAIVSNAGLCWEGGPATAQQCVSFGPPTGQTYMTRRLRRFMLPFAMNEWVFLRRLEFIVQSGMGLVTGQGAQPVMMFRLSRDGGQTWGPETMLSAGAIGEYQRRVYVTRLGRARNPVVEITMTDPILWALIDATIDADVGVS